MSKCIILIQNVKKTTMFNKPISVVELLSFQINKVHINVCINK